MAAGEHQVPDVIGTGKFARLYFEFQEMQEGGKCILGNS